ncbi:nuclear transport factor 2 family protein [candidate division WOR-3 bacterium]|nr:nuclear transport factor 2 family protein [candidate division WOR-3 bacterium]
MNSKDPKLTALQFNECINNQDIKGLSDLMTEDHTFIDREGKIDKPKVHMIECWISFFKEFPDYKNTFTRVESQDNLVILIGYAYWSEKNKYDPAIWTATIKNDLVAEWKIYEDTEENRKKLNII